MTRRQFAASLGVAAARAANPDKPNIIVILADDLGYGDLGCYNPESKIATPRLDQMAKQGVRFVDAHTPSGVCSPTRYGLLTGRYPWRSRLKTSVLWPWDEPLIEDGRLTLPAMLRKQGYRTGAFGKWHLGWTWHTRDGSRMNVDVERGDQAREKRAAFAAKIDFTKPVTGGPTSVGFDYFFGVDLPNFPPYSFIENETVLAEPIETKPEKMFGWPGPMAPGWRLEGVMPEITRRAVRFIEQSDGQPFFLYFPMTAPHTPIAPEEEFKGKSRAGAYGDFVQEVDWAVGEVLDALKRKGLERNTILFFTSDNGPENLTYPVAQEYAHFSMGKLRGAKRMLWEGGHRVPFIVWGPGRVPARSEETETVCLTDVMATVAGMLGIALPNDAAEDSYDVSSAVFGRPRKAPIREATVHYSMDGQFAIRRGDWVYLDSRDGGGGRAEPEWMRKRLGVVAHQEPAELFNLRADPAQTRNLYSQEPSRVRELKAILEKYKREARSTPPR